MRGLARVTQTGDSGKQPKQSLTRVVPDGNCCSLVKQRRRPHLRIPPLQSRTGSYPQRGPEPGRADPRRHGRRPDDRPRDPDGNRSGSAGGRGVRLGLKGRIAEMEDRLHRLQDRAAKRRQSARSKATFRSGLLVCRGFDIEIAGFFRLVLNLPDGETAVFGMLPRLNLGPAQESKRAREARSTEVLAQPVNLCC
jgi:hypothetical protein